jgi:hypothetical protein
MALTVVCMTACIGTRKKVVALAPPPPLMPERVVVPRPAPEPVPVTLTEIGVPPMPDAAAGAGPASAPPAMLLEATAELRKIPMFDAVYEVDRPTFDIIANMIVEAETNKASRGALLDRAMPVMQPRIKRYLRVGSDEAVVAFYEMVIRQFESASKTPAGCKAMLAGGGAAPMLSGGSDVTAFIEVQVVLTDLIRSVKGRSIEPLMDDARARVYMLEVVDEVAKDPKDRDLFLGVKGAEPNPMRQCQLTIGVLKGIAARPTGVAADLFRFLAARQP